MVKNLPANTRDPRDLGYILGSGRPPGGGNGNPLQYSCLETPMDGGAWRAPCGCTESDMTEHACTHTYFGYPSTCGFRLQVVFSLGYEGREGESFTFTYCYTEFCPLEIQQMTLGLTY